jgi:hypothetical protein
MAVSGLSISKLGFAERMKGVTVAVEWDWDVVEGEGDRIGLGVSKFRV